MLTYVLPFIYNTSLLSPLNLICDSTETVARIILQTENCVRKQKYTSTLQCTYHSSVDQNYSNTRMLRKCNQVKVYRRYGALSLSVCRYVAEDNTV